MQYLAPTPEPDKPTNPVDNGKLAAYLQGWRFSLQECNTDKQTLYDLYNKKESK